MTRAATLAGYELAESLGRGLDALALPLPEKGRASLLGYLDLLEKWSRTYNLTAIRDPAKMLTHHVLDSLAVLPALDALVAADPEPRVLDVGSGAGLPGIPLAVARPTWQVTMLEPIHKKAAFITQALAELELPGAKVEIGRVEDFRPQAPFAIVISRAFADLDAFAEASWRHLAPGGRLVAMKGVHPDEELRELAPTFNVISVAPLAVPGVEGARHLVVMERKAV